MANDLRIFINNLSVFLLLFAHLAPVVQVQASGNDAVFAELKTRSQVVRQLKEYNAVLSDSDFLEKLQSPDSSFRFLRTFVPIYWDYASRTDSWLPELHVFQNFRSWVHGDAHPENLKVVLDDKGRGWLRWSDFDDCGEGLLILDYLRLLVSLELAGYDESYKQSLKYYLLGLQSGKNIDSLDLEFDVTEKLIERAQRRGLQTQKRFLENPSRLSRDQGDRIFSEIKKAEWREVEEFLSTFGVLGSQQVIYDMMRFHRPGGGSGGMDRILVLTHEHRSSEPLVLELKQRAYPAALWAHPQVSELTLHQHLNLGLRSMDYVFATELPSYFGVFMWKGHSWELRPRRHGHIGLDVLEMSSKDFNQWALQSAYELGRLHRGVLRAEHGAHILNRYITALDNIGHKTLRQQSQLWAKEYERIYELLK